MDDGAGLELDGDGLVRAFHEESAVPVSQARSGAALKVWFSMRRLCAVKKADLPDELHDC